LRRIVPFGSHPDWSPDASKIAFAGASFNGIWVVNASGGTPVLLFDNVSPAYAPAWSPDGTKIVFNSSLGITVMNADGSNPTGLTSGYFPTGSRSP
jgi:Tol biopolymer transport system component